MTPEVLERKINEWMQASISVEARGLDDYRVHLPFTFPDGDELKMVFKRGDNGWELTDEGHTLMFLSYYDLGISQARRVDLTNKILRAHSMQDRNGRFVMSEISDVEAADAVFTFAQALLTIGDLSMWEKEKAKLRFKSDFRSAVLAGVRGRKTEFDYVNKEHDHDRLYVVDSMVTLRNDRPLYIFGVNSDEKANRSMVSIYHFQKYTREIPMCVVFSADDAVSNTTRSRVNDAADKTLSSLDMVPERLDSLICEHEVA